MVDQMNMLINMLVSLLVTRRITSLIVDDEITSDIRDAWLARWNADTTKLGYLVTCRKCSSVWAGAATLLLLSLTKYRLVRVIVGALALSEASITIDKLQQPEDTGFDL